MTSRGPAWIFTLLSYTPAEEQMVRLVPCSYMVYGHEHAPTTQMPHLQGYVVFSTKKTFSTVKRAFPGRCHLELARGTPSENRVYCTKEDTQNFYEHGVLPPDPAPGTRTDLITLRTTVLATGIVPILTITNYQQLRFAEALLKYVPIHHGPREISWFWGPTGSGKTKAAEEQFQFDYDLCQFHNGFIIGYTGNKNVIFDDYRHDDVNFSLLLKITDRTKLKVSVKGSEVPWNASHMIFTAPVKPADLFMNFIDPGAVDQLLRRITTVREFTMAP